MEFVGIIQRAHNGTCGSMIKRLTFRPRLPRKYPRALNFSTSGLVGRSGVTPRCLRLSAVAIAAALMAMVVISQLFTAPRTLVPSARVPITSGAWQASAASLILLQRAEAMLIRGCMQRHGFGYAAVVPDDSAGGKFPLVLDDPPWAARYGYGSLDPLAAQRNEIDSRNARYVALLSVARRRAYVTALYGARTGPQVRVALPDGVVIGHSTRGCQAAAEGRLYGDFPRWYATTIIAENLPGVAKQHVTTEPQFQLSLAAWARCMRSGGHVTNTPQQWRAQLMEQGTGKKLASQRAMAKRFATAEAECARRTKFGIVSRGLYDNNLVRLQETHSDVFRDQRNMRRSALRLARRILAGFPEGHSSTRGNARAM